MSLWNEVNWEEAFAEALTHFKALLRFETVNPPGNEKPAAEYLAEVFRQDGLEPELFESAPHRANVVCRLRGRGEKPPVLLSTHLDVVGVERERWSCDPFAAVEKDGCLYGRGAVDMKNMVTMSLMCLLLLKRAGAVLKRDLIFCGTADEEAGGRDGAQFLVREHPDKVRAEYSLGEVGGFPVEMDQKRFYLVQVAEKGACWFRVKTRGQPGHGSIPDRQSALIKAAGIAARLGARRLPQHNVPVMKRFVRLLSPQLRFPQNLIFRSLLCPGLSNIILDKILPDKDLARALEAMLHNTANPTLIQAGEKINVIPSQATLQVDGRLLPGFAPADLVREVRALIGAEPEIEIMHEFTPTEAPVDDPLLDLIAEVLARHDPGAVLLPNLVTAFTDASHWKKLGIKCYGFSPLQLPPGVGFRSLFHGHDERIPLEGFRFGLQVLLETVARLVT